MRLLSLPASEGVEQVKLPAVCSRQSCFLQVMKHEIVMKPGDSDVVPLPLKPGLLRVTGHAQGRGLFAATATQHIQTRSRFLLLVPDCC